MLGKRGLLPLIPYIEWPMEVIKYQLFRLDYDEKGNYFGYADGTFPGPAGSH